MGLHSPSLPMEQQHAFFQLLISHAPTFRLCKCLTTGSAQCEIRNVHCIKSEVEGRENQTLCIEGFLCIRRINPDRLLLYLYTFVLKSDHSRQEGRHKKLSALSLLCLRCRSIYMRALGISAGDYSLPVSTSFPYATSSGIVNTLSSSWGALLWSLHAQLFTNGTFKADIKLCLC